MTTVVSQHVRYLGHHLEFFINFNLCKTVANFSEISRKHVFSASNRNLIKNRVKHQLQQIFPKFIVFNFKL